MPSLLTRLSIGLLISLVILFIIQGVIVSRVIRSLTEDHIVSRLQHDADNLLAAVIFDKRGGSTLRTESVNTLYRRPFSGHYYRIVTGEKVYRSRSLWDRDLGVPTVNTGKTQRLLMSGPENQPLLVWAIGYRKQGHKLNIVVAEDMSSIEKNIESFQRRYVFITLVVLLLLIVLQGLIVRSGLRPLERVRREIQSLEQGERQTLSTEVPGEIRPLVTEINHLLRVLGQRLQRSRNTLGDLAHALKRPLTVLVQLLRDKELQSMPKIRRQIEAQTSNMTSITQQFLVRARLVADGPPAAEFLIDRDVAALVDALKNMYRNKVLSIETDLPDTRKLNIDREDMLELLGNLMDNACKWARSKVQLTVATNTDAIGIRVEDDGPGIKDPVDTDLTKRGRRLDESTEGHGLGLAIVNDIVSQYAGTISFGRSKGLGGFSVHVSVPLRGHDSQ